MAVNSAHQHFAYPSCLETFTTGLYETLVEYQQLGYVLDTRVHRFAYGLKLAKQLEM